MQDSEMKLSYVINDYLMERHRAENEQRKERTKKRIEEKNFKFYPSSISRCARSIVYDMLGYEKPEIPSRVLRIFDNGDSMHERYENLFAEMGILVSAELPFKDEELCVSGRTDALIRLGEELVLVELKSSNEKQFERMKRSNAPKEDYEEQLQLYMHLTGILKGIILVENKNDQSLLEFPIEYDNDLANELVNKIKLCIGCAKKGELPERQFEATSFQCTYCDFNNVCWLES